MAWAGKPERRVQGANRRWLAQVGRRLRPAPAVAGQVEGAVPAVVAVVAQAATGAAAVRAKAARLEQAAQVVRPAATPSTARPMLRPMRLPAAASRTD
jgi:hypothetical protein